MLQNRHAVCRIEASVCVVQCTAVLYLRSHLAGTNTSQALSACVSLAQGDGLRQDINCDYLVALVAGQDGREVLGTAQIQNPHAWRVAQLPPHVCELGRAPVAHGKREAFEAQHWLPAETGEADPKPRVPDAQPLRGGHAGQMCRVTGETPAAPVGAASQVRRPPPARTTPTRRAHRPGGSRSICFPLRGASSGSRAASRQSLSGFGYHLGFGRHRLTADRVPAVASSYLSRRRINCAHRSTLSLS